MTAIFQTCSIVINAFTLSLLMKFLLLSIVPSVASGPLPLPLLLSLMFMVSLSASQLFLLAVKLCVMPHRCAPIHVSAQLHGLEYMSPSA